MQMVNLNTHAFTNCEGTIVGNFKSLMHGQANHVRPVPQRLLNFVLLQPDES